MTTGTNETATLTRRLATEGIAIERAMITFRRRLHQHPEISFQEFATTQVLKRELARLGLAIHDGFAPTGLWAELDSGRPGPTIAVRTDIDALAVTERTGLPYASRREGAMHACGHDVHMAALLGTARLLARHRTELVGRVKFLCQPAEELPPGGARTLIAAGVLKNPRVDVILALHVDPMLPVGTIGVRDGVNFASVWDFDLRITGRSGHAAMPHKAIDAITAAAQIITALQQIVSRNIDPIHPAVITLGTIKGGQARNVIAGEVFIEGTARAADPALMKRIARLITRTATGAGRALGVKAEIVPRASYPVTYCHPEVNKVVAAAFRTVFPGQRIRPLPLVMGAEDFSCYLEKVPGTMFRLGIANKAIGADKQWHHSQFMVDEKSIRIGYTTMAAAVVHLLHHWPGGRR